MASTPEEFFVQGLIEPSPASPSVFLDLSPITNPCANNEGYLSRDDLVLPCISRMLMEEDTDDKLLRQYSDHPELLKIQESFSQVLPSPSVAANNDSTVNIDGLLVGDDDQITLSAAFPEGDYAVGEFLKGVEEASRFLPRGNTSIKDSQMNKMFKKSSHDGVLKKRLRWDDYFEEGSRITMEGQKEIDEMMSHGYEAILMGMEELSISMLIKKGIRKAVKSEVDLLALLIRCAEAVSINDHMISAELLNQIKQHASTTGDATQRLAQWFSKGLEARLAGKGGLLWNLLIAEQPSVLQSLKAYKLYMAACCFDMVAYTFSIMTIMKAMMGKSRLHIVDYGMHYGFQWASIIRMLAQREGELPELKITAIGRFEPMSYPAQRLEEHGHRLSNCDHKFGLPFKFQAVTKKWDEVCIESLNIEANEVLVVNDSFKFNTLMDENVFFDDPNPRDIVLNNTRKMRPDVFIQSILNCTYGTCFSSRFSDALSYCLPMFDMLDATVTRESESRLVLEQGFFQSYALNAITCEGMDLVERPERYRQWQARNQRAGLRQLPLDPEIVKVLKDMIKNYHKDFFLGEDGRWLLQGWKELPLLAHSTWVAEDASSE